MTPGELEQQLSAFQRDRGEAELAPAAGGPLVSPHPDLDDRHCDLFRPEARAVVEAARPAPWARARWDRFIEAGMGRRRAAEPRRRLASLLDGELGAGRDLAWLQDAACEAAEEALRLQGNPPRPADPTGNLGRLARRLADGPGDPAPGAGSTEPDALSAALPARGLDDLWEGLVAAGRYLRRGDGQVRTRHGRSPRCIALAVPDDVVLVLPEVDGAVSSTLAAAGEALALAHLPPSLPAADRLLPGDAGACLYGRLLSRRLLEPEWLAARRLPVEVAAPLRRAHARRLRRLAAAALDGGPDSEALALRRLAGWPSAAAETVARACEAPLAEAALDGERLAALLDHALARRFGRRWDESPRAAGLLRDLWSEGWARPAGELLSFLGEEDADGELLLEEIHGSP